MTQSTQHAYYPIDFPIGKGKTDYEKYLKIPELLSLQKDATIAVSPEELLFQITHQTSELWMKQILHELDRVLEALAQDQVAKACRSLRLVTRIQQLLIDQVDLLGQHLSIVEYGKIRTALGQGSGMESPGFNYLLASPEKLWTAFKGLIERKNIPLRDIYTQYEEHLELHTLAEHYVDYDDLFHKWRTHHMDLVTRTIGLDANSLKGIPTKVLQRGVLERCFPELLALRNTLTNESGLAYGGTSLLEA